MEFLPPKNPMVAMLLTAAVPARCGLFGCQWLHGVDREAGEEEQRCRSGRQDGGLTIDDDDDDDDFGYPAWYFEVAFF